MEPGPAADESEGRLGLVGGPVGGPVKHGVPAVNWEGDAAYALG